MLVSYQSTLLVGFYLNLNRWKASFRCSVQLYSSNKGLMRAINIDELFKLLSIWLTHHLDSCSLIPLCPPCPLCVSLSVVTVECRIETWDIFPRCCAHNIGVCVQMKLKTHYPQPLCCLPHLACCIHHDSILTLVIGTRLMSQVNCYLDSTAFHCWILQNLANVL